MAILFWLLTALTTAECKWNWKDTHSESFVSFSSVDLFCINRTENTVDICKKTGWQRAPPGVAVFDCNNDGFDDLLFPGGTSNNGHLLFINSGNNDFTFSEESVERGLNISDGGAYVLTVDLNNDGWIDIVFSSILFLIKIYKNVGNCYFEDITDESVPYLSKFNNNLNLGITLTTGIGGPMAAGDYDHDGDLDIVLSSMGFPFFYSPYQYSGTTYLWTNQFSETGAIKFIPAFYQPILPTSISYGCAISFEDFDEDGWDDIILSACNHNTFGGTYLWKNVPYFVFDPDADPIFYANKRIFIESSNNFTIFGAYGSLGFSMCHAFGDFNGDNHFDILMTDMGLAMSNDIFNAAYQILLEQYPLSRTPHAAPTRLFQAKWKKNKLKQYVEIAEDIDIDRDDIGWGALLNDVDNDGWDDIIFQGNYVRITPLSNPGYVYKNIPSIATNTRHTEFKQNLGLELSNTVGLAYGDFNNDGFIDFIINSWPQSDLPPQNIYLFKNDGQDDDDSNVIKTYLDISLRGDGVNTNFYGINSLIQVKVGKIKYNRIGKIRAGTNWASTDAYFAHFGIPFEKNDYSDDDIQDITARVTVQWIGSGKIETFRHIKLNQKITLYENQGSSLIKW